MYSSFKSHLQILLRKNFQNLNFRSMFINMFIGRSMQRKYQMLNWNLALIFAKNAKRNFLISRNFNSILGKNILFIIFVHMKIVDLKLKEWSPAVQNLDLLGIFIF